MAYKLSKLRPYQSDALYHIEKAQLDGLRRVAVVMATGLGKTVVMASYLSGLNVEEHGKVLILCHREKLCEQIFSAVKAFNPHKQLGLEQGTNHSSVFNDDIIVGTVQSVSKRLNKFPPEKFGMIIIDEAHHNSSKSSMYNAVMDHFASVPFMINFTATYFRADGIGFSDRCDQIIYEYSLQDGVADGYLIKPVPYVIGVKDLKFESKMANFSDEDLDLALTEDTKKMLELTAKIVAFCKGKKTLVFVQTQNMCERLCHMINNHPDGGGAAYVHGNLHKQLKQEFFDNVASGKVQYAIGCDMLIEGFDWPECQVIVVAKPISAAAKSRLIQIAGRGTRPLPEIANQLNEVDKEERLKLIASSQKPTLPVLDLVAFSRTHDFASCSSIDGDVIPRELRNEIAKIAEKLKEPVSMEEIKKQAEENLARQREEEEKKKREAEQASFAIYAQACIEAAEAEGINKAAIQEEIGRISDPPTEKQIEWLKAHGMFDPSISRSQASAIIGTFQAKNMPKWMADIFHKKRPDFNTYGIDYYKGMAMMIVMGKRQWKGPFPKLDRSCVTIIRSGEDHKYRVFVRDYNGTGKYVKVFGPYTVGLVAKKIARKICQ